MAEYQHPNKKNWSGRNSKEQLYLHEKVECIPIEKLPETKNQIALLGYACDEGVRRNNGRVGAKEGPDHIKKALAKLPNHLKDNTPFYDLGNILCIDGDMENAQIMLSEMVFKILESKGFPVLLGGGHDIAYGHFNGIKKYIGETEKNIGIINFDAHFDLRKNEKGNNSGTPFYQLANENPQSFHYLCLGIRQDANDRNLFQTAAELGVAYIEIQDFYITNLEEVETQIKTFLSNVDHVCVTIDLDGFSSAYAPGVSAPSPMGFAPDIVLKSLETIISSEKLISLDIAEMNPIYDIDGQTSKLAASLIHFVTQQIDF